MSLAGNNKVYVVGVGLTKFIKPGNPKNPDYPAMGKQAILRALHDADLPYSAIEQATASYVYGDSTCGQRVLYEVGLTGIPIYNINNNCSSGASAIFMCHQFIKSGLHDCCLAIGFEKMEKGSLGIKFTDREAPLAPQLKKNDQWVGQNPNSPWAPQFFGNAGREHMKKYGTKESHFAKIAYKNHLHSTNNPYSQFKDFYTLNQIENSPKVYDMLTKLQCCPTSDGAGAVILASREFVLRNNLEDQAVEILGMAMATDTASTFDDQYRSSMSLAGYDMTENAAKKLYKETGIGPEKIQVCELHDCFSANELITYEALGLCPKGQAGRFIDQDLNTYGGQVVVNPSGGLISKGHPLGATGMAQCAELVWQLRGMAGARQVKDTVFALQHNLGLGGAAVVGIYKKKTAKRSARDDVSADPEYLEELEKNGMLRSQKRIGKHLGNLIGPKPKL